MKARRDLVLVAHAALSLGTLGALGGCGNPVIDQKVAALPPEVAGVKESEWHRPGQPCLLCHGPYGGAKPEMSLAGTVFATPGKSPTPVGDVTVTITDSFGDVKTKKTNCIGNFFITAEEWQPGFPLAAKIEYPAVSGSGTTPAYMSTRIGREGSCAACHQGRRGEDSPGSIYCLDATTDPFPKPAHDCPGVPSP
jgi:hypothetical protein